MDISSRQLAFFVIMVIAGGSLAFERFVLNRRQRGRTESNEVWELRILIGLGVFFVFCLVGYLLGFVRIG